MAEAVGTPPAARFIWAIRKPDMQTAQAAGMFAVGALWGFRTAEELLAHGAQRLLTHPLELLPLLEVG